MPESEFIRLVIQGGAVTVLVWIVWAFMSGKVYPASTVLDLRAQKVALEGKLTEKDQVIAALMGELKANIRAQEAAARQSEQASELVDPALFERIMRGIQDGIKKSLKGAR